MQEQILSILKDQLEFAKEQHRQAKEHFWEILGKPPKMPRDLVLQHADKGEQVRMAVSQENHARTAHLDALLRLNEFLINGKVPDDLRISRETSRELPLKRSAGAA